MVAVHFENFSVSYRTPRYPASGTVGQIHNTALRTESKFLAQQVGREKPRWVPTRNQEKASYAHNISFARSLGTRGQANPSCWTDFFSSSRSRLLLSGDPLLPGARTASETFRACDAGRGIPSLSAKSWRIGSMVSRL